MVENPDAEKNVVRGMYCANGDPDKPQTANPCETARV